MQTQHSGVIWENRVIQVAGRGKKKAKKALGLSAEKREKWRHMEADMGLRRGRIMGRSTGGF